MALLSIFGFLLSFYLGLGNSIIFYERLPKSIPEHGFLVFYQPTCPHCIAEIPKIKKLLDLGYNVSALNVFEAKELVKEYKIEVTPTIIVFPSRIKVEGEADVEDLIKLINSGKTFEIGGEGCRVEVESCS